MKLLPAIDMMDGKAVRLIRGEFDKSTVFGDDPAEMARRWEDCGAEILHLVDLNGSRKGAPQETETIKRIIKAVKIPVELGGGIRSLETAEKMLDLGVSRVIIGTSAAVNPELGETIFRTLGERAVLGVDAKDGKVAVSGWEQTTEETSVEFAVKMQSRGAKRIIYTDISKDGMMTGVNVEATAAMARALDIPVIASGGVASLEDIKKLIAVEDAGIEGAILGKALYTGAIDLPEAIRYCKEA
ncbi:MAG: 1-(5-phosphoribosyl)-5-[(5-phosphoribosylamino)methylideneamino]imidazole-4-carboxamide isomerase [Abditibacteriota bacterium]|nr:1-(5-phosphoribosyl)-5-[(5-phosphoribosylamino)methylideneamino]imidazole-4-carboxamide isomerase [Abditibacteriota bacterium]